jgi:hypothetical protein
MGGRCVEITRSLVYDHGVVVSEPAGNGWTRPLAERRPALRCSLLLLFSVVVLAAPIGATTIHVPSQYPTIQAGINAAAPGDTVLIACGSYHEWGIEMQSGICLRGETGEPDCVTIYTSSHVLILCYGVDGTTSIEGITLGYASGAVWMTDSSPMFTNCVIQQSWEYPGVECNDSSPTFTRCTFFENQNAVEGGAMWCYESHPTLVECLFRSNSCWYEGGAIACWGGSASITDCVFDNNNASSGGGVFGNEATLSASGCTFFENTAGSGPSVYADDTSVSLANCTVYRDGCGGYDGVIHLTGSSHADIVNCSITFSRHYCVPMVCEGSSDATLMCCDIYGNPHGDWVGCIGDQYGINGNISEDPLFCDPQNYDLTLQACSPCAPFTLPNPECDQIGAWPVGCGGTPVTETTWGGIKAMFRE